MPKLKKRHSRWFDIPDDPLQGRLHVVHLSAADQEEITSKTVDSRMIDRGLGEDGQRRIESEVKVDNVKNREMVAVAAVLGWENHQDEAGRVLECTPENKRLFSRDSSWLATLIGFRKVLAEEARAMEEEERKNSKALPPGQPA